MDIASEAVEPQQDEAYREMDLVINCYYTGTSTKLMPMTIVIALIFEFFFSFCIHLFRSLLFL